MLPNINQNQPTPNKRSTQKINPGGDKEYRDYLRSSRSNSPQAKNLPKSRDISPQINNQPNCNPINTNLPKYPRGGDMVMKCGWCFHHNTPHNHTTAECSFLQNANVADRWHITYRNRLCQQCLLPGHYWKECTSSIPPCNGCNISHHPILGCRPIDTISPKPTTY